MRIRYKSSADEVNTRTFRCLVPVSYFRRIGKTIPKREEIVEIQGTKFPLRSETIVFNAPPPPTSFYNPINPDQRETSYITLANMVDLFVKKTNCEVINDLDVIHALHLADRYMEEVEEWVRQRIPDFVDFVRNLSEFRREFLYPTFVRILHRKPNLLEEYRTYNTGINITWLRLLGVSTGEFKDGITNLRHPVYDIDSIVHPTEVVKTVTGIDGKPTQPPVEDAFYQDLFRAWGKDD